MSIDLMSAVFERGPKDTTQRFVLLALADRANHEGYCWPSYADIAARCAISRSTAIRAVKALEADGWLTRQERWRPDQSQQATNGYFISRHRLGVVSLCDQGGVTVPPPLVAQRHQGSSTVTLGVVAQCDPNPHIEPSNNHQGEPSTAEAERLPAVKRRAAAAVHPRLKAIGLGTNAKTLALLELPHFDDDYAAAMVAWAQRAGKETGLAIKKIEDGDPVPGPRPVDLTRQIPADLADIIQR
jgi:hypothetical protein